MRHDFRAQDFRHSHTVRVRTFHVDPQNVVHNIRYFYFFEEARLEYFRAVGMRIDPATFFTEPRFFIAHNSCDYLAPAIFDHEIEVFTRISRVGHSSLGFEHAAVDRLDGTVVALGAHVLVHVDVATDKPSRIPDHLRDLIRAFEGVEVFEEKDDI